MRAPMQERVGDEGDHEIIESIGDESEGGAACPLIEEYRESDKQNKECDLNVVFHDLFRDVEAHQDHPIA